MEKYIIYKDKLIGEGVDGKIYKANIEDKEIVVKIMDNQFENEDKLKEFIQINKIASEKDISPTIYDIYFKDDLIYIFMEKMDGTIDDFIKQKIKEGKKLNLVLEEVINKIKIIHEQLKNNKITIEENISDNYMIKGNIIKRIDFTKSKIKKILSNRDIKKYKFVYIDNPISKIPCEIIIE